MGAQIRLWDPKQDYGSKNEIMGAQMRLWDHTRDYGTPIQLKGSKTRVWDHKRDNGIIAANHNFIICNPYIFAT